MQPLDRMSPSEARGLSGLLFDLDDTFLDRGRLDLAAYGALFRLRQLGLGLIAVTGRPAGWGAVLARQWPVDAVICENGALALQRTGNRVARLDETSASERDERGARLRSIAAEVARELPELTPSEDCGLRISDYTFDIGEERTVARERVEQAAALARRLGARTLVSTVHLHLTLDGDDKASGAVRLLNRLHGLDPTAARRRWAFVGDSENDESCFAAFHTTIGVKNLSGRPSIAPRYSSRGERSAGFVELERVLAERRG
jgi:HAD superfamily hydrolase (TIGR01484 family)